MLRCIAVLVLAAALASCGPGLYPLEPHICVTNQTRETLPLVTRTPKGGAKTVALRLAPGERRTFFWGWADEEGQMLAGQYFTPIFQPWSKRSWSWNIGGTFRPEPCK